MTMTHSHFTTVEPTRTASSFAWGKLGKRVGIGLGTAAIVIFAIFPIYWMVVVALSRLGASRSANQSILVESAQTEGYIVLRALAPLPSFSEAVSQFLDKASCAPFEWRSRSRF